MKTKPIIIGLTGGIASGKSTATQVLRRKRIPVICADEIAHDVTRINQPAYKAIIKTFGKEILQKNKRLNRQRLAKIVFTDPKLKKKLEGIVHPAVRKEIHAKIKELKEKGKRLIILDIPLLFESGWHKKCDYTICIAAPQNTQIERLIKHRKMTHKHALERIRSQMPLKDKMKLADFVIWNKGTKQSFQNAVFSRIQKFQ
jgi:dephospho-CoA kinase